MQLSLSVNFISQVSQQQSHSFILGIAVTILLLVLLKGKLIWLVNSQILTSIIGTTHPRPVPLTPLRLALPNSKDLRLLQVQASFFWSYN